MLLELAFTKYTINTSHRLFRKFRKILLKKMKSIFCKVAGAGVGTFTENFFSIYDS